MKVMINNLSFLTIYRALYSFIIDYNTLNIVLYYRYSFWSFHLCIFVLYAVTGYMTFVTI